MTDPNTKSIAKPKDDTNKKVQTRQRRKGRTIHLDQWTQEQDKKTMAHIQSNKSDIKNDHQTTTSLPLWSSLVGRTSNSVDTKRTSHDVVNTVDGKEEILPSLPEDDPSVLEAIISPGKPISLADVLAHS
jgi:hypothetical protein